MSSDPDTVQNAVMSDNEKAAYERTLQESLLKGIIGGAIGGLIGSAVWASITYASNTKIGWLAIGIGFLAGFGIRLLGKGTGVKFKVAGAAIALLACALGNYFTVIAFASKEMQMGFFQALTTIPLHAVPDIMKETFTPMDVLFYALSGWCGWKYSSREE